MRVDKLKLPGKEGGCAAVEITLEEVRAAAQREGTPLSGEGGDRVAAIEDLKGFLKAVLKLRNHKAFPPGSVPAELLKAVLFPSWLHRDRSKPGVGAPTMQATLSKLSSFPVRNCVRKIFRMIRATQRSPVAWHSAQAAYVSKHNGKAWTEGERVVMVMCPFGRAFHRSILQRGLAASPLTYSPWTFGSIPGRRREEAILLQLVTSWRLRRAGISHVTRMHDGVNVFLSVRQPYIVDAARPPFVEKEMDHELLRQHVQQATVRVGQGNEARTLLAREGAWPGDYAVPLLFVRGAMAAYDGEPAHTRARRVLRSLSPFTGQEFCFDKTGYVDDVAGKAVGALTAAAEQAVLTYEQHITRARAVSLDEGENRVFPEYESEEDPWAGAGVDEEEQEVRAGPDRGEVRELVPKAELRSATAKHSANVEAQVRALQAEAAAENDYIDRSMQALGMRQHAGKMENVMCIVGKGTRAVSAYLAQKGALMGSTLEASRYLGTRLTRTGTFSYERAVRMQATRAGWLQFGKYWQSRSPFRQRRSLFKGVVQGAALSGLETATGVKGPLTPGEVAPIDRLLVKFGRVLLRGTAKTNAEGGVRAVPNVVIWRKLRLVPTFHELRYRRVDAVLTGLLGQFAFENQSTVAEDGSLMDSANPWAQQLLADVLSLLFLESAAELRVEWDRSVLSLFGQSAEFFQKIDLNEARATNSLVNCSITGSEEK